MSGSASPTVLSAGSVTIKATGGYTGDLLQRIVNATSGSTSVLTGTSTAGNGSALPAAPTTSGTYALVIPSTYTGSLSIPSGYNYVLYSGTGELTGGTSSTVVVGNNLNYSGGAGTVVATGTGTVGATVTDSIASALISVYTGTYTVNASGGSDTVVVDTGSSAVVNATGSNDTVLVGTPPTNVATGSVATQASGGAAETINAAGTNNIIYDYSGGNLINLGGSDEYVSNSATLTASTVVGTGGNDTVIATAATDFIGTAASSSLFVGSDVGVVTVASAVNQTVVGAAGGGTYTEGAASTGSFAFFGHFTTTLGAAVTDSIVGSASSPTVDVWGNSEENEVVSQAGTAKGFLKGNSFVGYGEGDTINATHTTGGDNFILFNVATTANPSAGGNFVGNSTLFGSSAGNELFAFFGNLGYTTVATPAHTITIENWVSSDVLGLGVGDGKTAGFYTSGDASGLLSALTAAKGGSASYTLSDGTTIKFVGASPTSETTAGADRYYTG